MSNVMDYRDSVSRLDDPTGARANALSRFEGLGVPSRRLEDWHYTDLTGRTWSSLAGEANDDTSPAVALDGSRIDIINGRISVVSTPGNGIYSTVGEPIAPKDLQTGLEALTGALAPQALHLRISGEVELPLSLVYRARGADKQAIHNQVHLIMDAGARLTLFEDIGGDASDYWHNRLLTVDMAEGARLLHVVRQDEGAKATATAMTRVNLAANARYAHHVLALGAQLGRGDVYVHINGAGAHADVRAAQLAVPDQSLDLRTYLDHRVANATSDQIAKAVVAARGRTAYQGKVRVARDAQKTDAQQQSNNLLLDRAAEANTKPELEIYADDVVCAHGATVGELDADALFYLISRGLSPSEARATLIRAFAAGAFEDLDNETLREHFIAATGSWLDERSAP